ncbi:hypothetical protein OOT33_14305 [Sphingobium sp. DEHP117]|uniref:hypothetical protein n=1 Tax=Sphingobium sp. DEHP117 TaxID=2993436 RepID=UPI0027D4EA28|nr:hypothetical protein [Sphingobium sp. DEHP117]MDQ4421596.1 hypothetical protein [Sphingobium sp. DEHP117]
MYEFVDRPVTSLDNGSRFLVWSMRNWVAACAERQCPGSRIAEGFARWGMLRGLHPFLRIMALLNRHGLTNLEFCKLGCNHIAEGEAIILGVIASGLRCERSLPGTLECLVEEGWVGDLVCSISELAQAMRSSPKLSISQ